MDPHTIFNALIVFGPFSAVIILLLFVRAAKIQRDAPEVPLCPTCHQPLPKYMLPDREMMSR